MYAWRDDGRLVSVDGVEAEKEKDFVGNLARSEPVSVLPQAEQPQIGGPRTEAVHKTEDAYGGRQELVSNALD